MICGRRNEGGIASRLAPSDEWRQDGTCSYCGSISPEELFKVIEDGGDIDPTDKSYKIYVHDANPNVGQLRIFGTTNFDAGKGYILVTEENLTTFPDYKSHLLTPGTTWVQLAPDSAMRMRKFYFQHLDQPQRDRFIALLNDKKIKIGYPGHFYVLPYFCRAIPSTNIGK